MGEKKLLIKKGGCLCDGAAIIYGTSHMSSYHKPGADYFQDHVFELMVRNAIKEHFGLGYCFRCGKSLDLMDLEIFEYSQVDGTPIYRVNYRCKEGGFFSRHSDIVFYLGKMGPDKIWYIEKGVDSLDDIYG